MGYCNSPLPGFPMVDFSFLYVEIFPLHSGDPELIVLFHSSLVHSTHLFPELSMELNKTDLIDYLGGELGIDTSDLDETTLLFSTGIIDSFALVSLIVFIEGKYDIKVQPMEVQLDNMDSIDRILRYVEGKQS